MKEVSISQLDDYDTPFCELQYTRGSCYISLFKFKTFDELNTPQTALNFRHLLSCGTIVYNMQLVTHNSFYNSLIRELFRCFYYDIVYKIA